MWHANNCRWLTFPRVASGKFETQSKRCYINYTLLLAEKDQKDDILQKPVLYWSTVTVALGMFTMQAMGSKQLVDSGCFLCFQVDDGRLRSLIIGKEGVNIKQLRQNTSVDVHIGDFLAFRSCEYVWRLFLA